MKRASLFALPLVLSTVALLHCGDDPAPAHVTATDGGGGGTTADTGAPDRPFAPASKVDLLFVVDNSASMGDKQSLLATSVSRVLHRLVEGVAGAKPVADMHIGVISSSIGTQGGDVCALGGNPRTNDKAHLLNLGPGGQTVVPGAEKGFLAYGPGAITDVNVLEKAAEDMIRGVDQTGCGFEGQLEAMYRFVAQPDPPDTITVDGASGKAVYGPVDDVLLAQRKAFFRPDSAVAIVMLTDEDDSEVDPRAYGGQGWAFANRDFPGSNVRRGTTAQGTTAPKGSSACATDPASKACTSCEICNRDGSCASDPVCSQPPAGVTMTGPGVDGFYGPTEDDLNIRFYEMKRRFGIDPQYPVARYIDALTSFQVPNRDTEHDDKGNYVPAATCTNPLFAATLPSSSGEEICKLPAGTRSRQLVLFQLIGGLPPALATDKPDWVKILGKNRAAFDETGIDPHMIQSSTARPGLTGADSPVGDNGTDPVNGREWTTNGTDLQYACTFALPTPRVCTPYDVSCDCANQSDPPRNPPLCATDGTTQIRAKAYPTIRELQVVQGLGERGLVGSICAADPVDGYGPILEALATKLGGVLQK